MYIFMLVLWDFGYFNLYYLKSGDVMPLAFSFFLNITLDSHGFCGLFYTNFQVVHLLS